VFQSLRDSLLEHASKVTGDTNHVIVTQVSRHCHFNINFNETCSNFCLNLAKFSLNFAPFPKPVLYKRL